MTLQETYKMRLNKLIVEELGISDLLHSKIIPEFQRRLKSAIRNSEIDTNYRVQCKHGKFDFNCFDDKNTIFHIYWKLFNFKTNDEYEEFTKQNSIFNGVFYEFKMINITIVYINGYPLDNHFYDTIGHELEHAYQNILMKKDFGNKNIYATAITHINSENKYLKCLGNIVYGSTKSEQEAMINGFYNEFTNGNVDVFNLDKEIEKSECGTWLKRLYIAYQFLKEHHNEEMLNAIRKFNQYKDYYNYKYFLYIARNGIKNLERRIARLTYKIKKSMVNDQMMKHVNENANLLNNHYLIK